jgi:hypothetical protein
LFSVHDPAIRALEWVFSEFPLFGENLCFHGIDVGTHQEEWLTLFQQLTSSTYAADHTMMPWLSYWYGFLYYGALGATGGNQSLLVPTLEQMGFANATYALTCPVYKLQKYMPVGPFIHDNPKVFHVLFNAHRRIPMPAEAYDTTVHPGLFIHLVLTSMNEFTFERLSSGELKPPLWQAPPRCRLRLLSRVPPLWQVRPRCLRRFLSRRRRPSLQR